MTTSRQHGAALGVATLCVFAILTILLSGCNPDKASGITPHASVYDRVIKSGTIRAAYLDYPPACMKDTQTGKLKGIFVEALEKAADNCGLKVQWTEEVGWGSQIEGLQTDRYDIVGSPVWANPNRGKLTTLSRPLYYSGIGIYVRKDDSRFTSDWNRINNAQIRIATVDGETGDLIARTQFPLAQRVSSPQNTEISAKFLDITGNKADVLFAEPYFGGKFLESNPNTVMNIAAEKPIEVLGNCYMMKRGETDLKHMLDVALEDLQNSGYIDHLMDKYEPSRNTFYRVALPYRIVK